MRLIDSHAHLHTGDRRHQVEAQLQDAKQYFKTDKVHATVEEMQEMYQALDAMAVIFDVDQETQSGLKISNDEIAAAMRRYPQTFIGFGSVDPWKGKVALKETERCVGELGLRGMKFQQLVQAFYPNDQRFYPLYGKCQELQVPVIFHMGTTGIGAGSPGGRGIRLDYGRPIYVDHVAADFPDLTIIGAHPAWPWQDEMLAVAVHKANVFIDLSGWAPKYFSPSLVQYANTLLQDKCMFGSDFPVMAPERWLKEFAELPIKDGVRQKILIDNARRVLKI